MVTGARARFDADEQAQSPCCTGDCNQGRRCPQRCERRIPFDYRLLLVVLACVYVPLFAVVAWHFVERAA